MTRTWRGDTANDIAKFPYRSGRSTGLRPPPSCFLLSSQRQEKWMGKQKTRIALAADWRMTFSFPRSLRRRAFNRIVVLAPFKSVFNDPLRFKAGSGNDWNLGVHFFCSNQNVNPYTKPAAVTPK